MKIAILGYGRMGRQIEEIALQNQSEITLRANSKTSPQQLKDGLQDADVAIDFTLPNVAYEVISTALTHHVPVISGTTAWLDKYEDIVQLCEKLDGAFLYGSNFSIGVNILFAINVKLAKLMNHQPQYRISMEEIHHTNKLDAPSGTAISLAEDIIGHIESQKDWVNRLTTVPGEVPIISKRERDVPGTHTIQYTSEVDRITIQHEARSRKGFAQGALLAAQWIIGKKGIFTMKDVLSI